MKRYAAITMILMGSLGVMAAGQSRRYDYSTQRELDAQEKHIDSVDAQAQHNKDVTQEILVRISGDEKLVQGGFGVIMFLLTSGGAVWYLRLLSNGQKYRRPSRE